MWITRPRFTVRGMMLAVAIVGLMCLGGREYWAWQLRQKVQSPVGPSNLSITADRHFDLIAGQSFPVTISYDFSFRNPMPPPGTSTLLHAHVWFEDMATGMAVNGYSFDARLNIGGRESASGSLTWDAMIPRPGTYRVREELKYLGPQDDFRSLISRSGYPYVVQAGSPGNLPPIAPGARP